MTDGRAMARQIGEQPAVLANLLARRGEIEGRMTAVRPHDLRGIVLVARGSSDNAAVYGRYVLEYATRRPVALAAPSLHTRYGVTTHLEGFLALGASQSGQTPEIIDTMATLRSGGAQTVAITNQAGSSLAEATDATVVLGAGEETAVPATKTFTAQLAAFALIAETLATWRAGDWEAALDAVAAVVAVVAVVADSATARAVADRISATERLVPVGRGFLYAIALEAGLKISETTGLTAVGYSPPDLQHGPIAIAGPALHALCFAAPGPTAADTAEVARALATRGTTVTAIAEDAATVPATGALLPVPGGVDEALGPLVHTVRAQRLALHLALARGLDPDRPPGLSKVTKTT